VQTGVNSLHTLAHAFVFSAKNANKAIFFALRDSIVFGTDIALSNGVSVMDSPMAKRVRGFTLVELMITVAILSILVLVTIPSAIKAIDAKQAVDAGQAVVDLIEFAKVQAAQRNRAYQVVPRLAGQDDSTNGFITLNEGLTSACINFNDPNVLKNVRMVDLSSSFPRIRLKATIPADLPVATLCIKPDGRVLRTDTKQPIPSEDVRYGAGDARFILQRFERNQPVGPEVVVVVPYIGAVRLLR